MSLTFIVGQVHVGRGGRSSEAQTGVHIHLEPLIPTCLACCVSGMPALPGKSETFGALRGPSQDIQALGSPTFLGLHSPFL